MSGWFGDSTLREPSNPPFSIKSGSTHPRRLRSLLFLFHLLKVLIAHYNEGDGEAHCTTETHQQQFKILKRRGSKRTERNESLFA